jgi:hypothetical protein
VPHIESEAANRIDVIVVLACLGMTQPPSGIANRSPRDLGVAQKLPGQSREKYQT